MTTTPTTTTIPRRQWWLARLRTRLAFWLLRKSIGIEVEARHGAFRTRHRELWKGGLVRVNIPLQKKHGVTDAPFGRLSSTEAKRLIDSFTGIEGEDPLEENRP